MGARIAAVTLLVDDYDEAIRFYCGCAGFRLVADTLLTDAKRWVLVEALGGGVQLLLAKAEGPEQTARVGSQHGGRVGFFLETCDFRADFASMKEAGVVFREEPRTEPYGTVAVFEDLYGNLWDLIQPTI